MMRTPGKVSSISKRRQPVSRALSSDQMAQLLYEPVGAAAVISPGVSRQKRAEGMNRSSGRKSLAGTKFGENIAANKSTIPSTMTYVVARKPLAELKPDENMAVNNSTEPISANKAFCKMFTGWLQSTEREYDGERFDRLKDELCKLVGKYALEEHSE